MVNGITGVSGGMSATMMQEMRAKMYAKVDSNSDGGVDETEFSDMTAHISEMTGEEMDSASLFSEFDANQDGNLDEDELDAFHQEQMANMPPPPQFESEQIELMRQDIFSQMDQDEDGQLNQDEFATMMENNPAGATSAAESEEIFNKMDSNEDGFVSQAEMDEYWSQQGMDAAQGPAGALGAQSAESDVESILMKILAGEDEDTDTTTESAAIEEPDMASYKPVDIMA